MGFGKGDAGLTQEFVDSLSDRKFIFSLRANRTLFRALPHLALNSAGRTLAVERGPPSDR